MEITFKHILALALIFNFFLILSYLFGASSTPMSLRQSSPLSLNFEDFPSPSWEDSLQWEDYLGKLSPKTQHSLTNDDSYCQQVKRYRTSHSLTYNNKGLPIKQNKYIYTDYESYQLPRKILDSYGTLVHKDNYRDSSASTLTPLSPQISIFYTKFFPWQYNHQIGKHFLCEGQKYNHIPGNVWLSNKDLAIDNFREYSLFYRDRQECFDAWKILPYSLNLVHVDQCEEFMQILKHAQNSTEIEWMIKQSRGVHQGKGVFLLTQSRAQAIQKDFDCPSTDRFILQKYIKNPLLIYNKKFDFRVYMLIASMDPLMILYRDGIVRISLEQYNSESVDANVHLTNTHVALELMKEKKLSEEEKEEVLEDQSWTFKEFEEYMIAREGVSKDWFEGKVKKFIKNMMFHLVRMNLDKLLKHPDVFELIGVDFLIDTNHDLWFLEANLTPAMAARLDRITQVYENTIKDMLDIEFALIHNADLDSTVRNTGFEWVYDGRKKGTARYHDLITPECL